MIGSQKENLIKDYRAAIDVMFRSLIN